MTETTLSMIEQIVILGLGIIAALKLKKQLVDKSLVKIPVKSKDTSKTK